MVVQYLHLKHSGGFYMYRVHQAKLATLCNDSFKTLNTYLQEMFSTCPHDYFDSGPRSSKLKFKTDHDMIEVKGHEVITLAEHGLEQNRVRFRDNHSRVQLFMLENDNNTVAIEIPVWLEAKELQGFKSFFGTEEPLTGHIDVVRVDGNYIWVWDYKPNALKEKFANTQVYFYSLMLSKRTGIPLEHFRCGYFDDKHAYVFQPEVYDMKNVMNQTLQQFSK